MSQFTLTQDRVHRTNRRVVSYDVLPEYEFSLKYKAAGSVTRRYRVTAVVVVDNEFDDVSSHVRTARVTKDGRPMYTGGKLYDWDRNNMPTEVKDVLTAMETEAKSRYRSEFGKL